MGFFGKTYSKSLCCAQCPPRTHIPSMHADGTTSIRLFVDWEIYTPPYEGEIWDGGYNAGIDREQRGSGEGCALCDTQPAEVTLALVGYHASGGGTIETYFYSTVPRTKPYNPWRVQPITDGEFDWSDISPCGFRTPTNGEMLSGSSWLLDLDPSLDLLGPLRFEGESSSDYPTDFHSGCFQGGEAWCFQESTAPFDLWEYPPPTYPDWGAVRITENSIPYRRTAITVRLEVRQPDGEIPGEVRVAWIAQTFGFAQTGLADDGFIYTEADCTELAADHNPNAGSAITMGVSSSREWVTTDVDWEWSEGHNAYRIPKDWTRAIVAATLIDSVLQNKISQDSPYYMYTDEATDRRGCGETPSYSESDWDEFNPGIGRSDHTLWLGSGPLPIFSWALPMVLSPGSADTQTANNYVGNNSCYFKSASVLLENAI